MATNLSDYEQRLLRIAAANVPNRFVTSRVVNGLNDLDDAELASLSLSELAERIAVCPRGMRRAIHHLVDLGIVRRNQPETGRRVTLSVDRARLSVAVSALEETRRQLAA